MKKTSFIAIVAGLILCGCSHRQSVDETIVTDRYTLHMQDLKTWNAANDRNVKSIYYYSEDTVIFSNSVPEMAYFLVSHHGLDTTTMYWFNQDKRIFLPKYIYTLSDSDTAQPEPDDYTPLLQALVDRGILRTDTTCKPLKLLVISDSAKFEASLPAYVEDNDSTVNNIASMVTQLREHYRMPVSVGPDIDMWKLLTCDYWLGNNWVKDSLWLDEHGLGIVPDPQGRQMSIVTFNRAKGKI